MLVISKELIHLIKNETPIRPNQPVLTWEQMNTYISSQKLWLQLTYGIRSLMLSVLRDPERTQASANRLYNIVAHNFNDYFRFFYGPETAQRVTNYLIIFITNMWGIFNAVSANNTEAVNANAIELYKNADEASQYFASINPHWSAQQWRNYLYQHIRITIQEAVTLAGKDFDKEFDVLSQLEDLSTQIGDYMAAGVISKNT